MEHVKKLLASVFCMAAMIVMLTACGSAGSEYTDIAVLSTTDIHGKFWDTNLLTDSPEPNNMLWMSEAVKETREEYGEDNVLLIDNGDLYQGNVLSQDSVLAYGTGESDAVPVMSRCVEEMKYDVFVPGNHEFNYAWDIMKTIYEDLEDSGISVIAANIYYDGSDGIHESGENVFTPYMTRKISVNGHEHTIGVLGLGNTDIERWDSPDKYPGMIFASPDNKEHSLSQEAAKYISRMKEEGCEYIIVSYHGAIGDTDSELVFNKNSENQGQRIIEETEGIGMLILGHDHVGAYSNSYVTDPSGRDVLVVNGGGTDVTRTKLRFGEDEDGSLTCETLDSVNLVAADYEESEELKSCLQPYVDAAEEMINTPIGKAEGEWDQSKEHHIRQTDSMDVVSGFLIDTADRMLEIQEKKDPDRLKALDHTDTDMAMQSVCINDYAISSGELTTKDAYKLYRFDNTIAVIPVTGRDIRAILEENAKERLTVRVHNGKTFIYNRGDVYANVLTGGLDFSYDMTKPEGERVIIEGFSNGREFRDDEVYTVSTITYYIGNHNCGLRKFSNDDVVVSQADIYPGESIQQLLCGYISRKSEEEGALRPDAQWHWSVEYNADEEAPDEAKAAVYAEKPEDGHSYVIFNEGEGRVLLRKGAEGSLSTAECEEYADVITGALPEDAAVLTAHEQPDGRFCLTDQDGKYLNAGTGRSLTLADEKGSADESLWELRPADGGWYIVNTGNEVVALEYYEEDFVLCPLNPSIPSRFTFGFYEVK